MQRELTPQSPCLVSAVREDIKADGIDKVDILFVVDSSKSMLDEQEKLSRQIPRLVETLASGVRADGTTFPAAKDLHLAVVTTDMGVPALEYPNLNPCTEHGEDAIFRTAPGPDFVDTDQTPPDESWSADASCKARTLPAFVSYTAGGPLSPSEAAEQLGCLAQVGPGGCGFEMQLEASLKALWPSADPTYTFLGRTPAHGDMENRDFLRGSAATGQSLIAVILVTDEDDCSAQDTQHLHYPGAPGSPYQETAKTPNLLCPYNPEKLWPVQRYIEGLRALRGGQENLVIFAAIAGVPVDLVDKNALAAFDRKDPASRKRFYDGIRADADMQLRNDTANLLPACRAQDGSGKADPALRILDVVEGFGEFGVIQSICQDNYEGAIDSIITLITEQLGDVCLPRTLVRNSQGEVDCNVYWTLPAPGQGPVGTPTRCEEQAYLSAPADSALITDDGRVRCLVNQVPVANAAPQAGEGWYYDDFSPERDKCRGEDKQRIAFSNGAQPPKGVVVNLECLNEVQSAPQTRTDLNPAFYVDRDPPAIGSPCEGDDGKCALQLLGGGVDQSLFCDQQVNVCVQRCSSDPECPPAWVCDARPETIASSGSAICVNPTCGVR